MGLARGFGEKLRLAGTVHSDEPPGRFLNGVANSQEAVIPQDGRFLPAKSAGDAVAFRSFLDDAGVIVEDRMIFIKRASVLRERIQSAAER